MTGVCDIRVLNERLVGESGKVLLPRTFLTKGHEKNLTTRRFSMFSITVFKPFVWAFSLGRAIPKGRDLSGTANPASKKQLEQLTAADARAIPRRVFIARALDVIRPEK